jgi:hypothetical protein
MDEIQCSCAEFGEICFPEAEGFGTFSPSLRETCFEAKLGSVGLAYWSEVERGAVAR